MPKIALDERIIDVSEKTTKEIGAIIETLRSKYAHAIIIEKGNEITQQFARNTDIILDPINGPYSWDIIDEFREDYIPLTRLLIKDLDNSFKKDLEQNLLKDFNFSSISYLNNNEILSRITSKYESLSYLNVLINNHQKTSIARYIQGHGNILMFVPCLKNPDLIRISQMIKVLAEDNGIYVIENMGDC